MQKVIYTAAIDKINDALVFSIPSFPFSFLHQQPKHTNTKWTPRKQTYVSGSDLEALLLHA